MDEQALQERLFKVGVPEHTIGGLARYVCYGTPTGGFLQAVLENKLLQAYQRADDMNFEAMFEIVGAIYNEVPNGCHGSPEKVEAWIAHEGMRGIEIGWWLEKERKWLEAESDIGDREYDRKRDDELTEVEV